MNVEENGDELFNVLHGIEELFNSSEVAESLVAAEFGLYLLNRCI